MTQICKQYQVFLRVQSDKKIDPFLPKVQFGAVTLGGKATLSIYLGDMETCVGTKNAYNIFLQTHQDSKQLKCPSSEWVNKLWCIDTMEDTLAIKRKELLMQSI